MADFSELKKNLISYGYDVSEFETAHDAANYINSVTDGKTVGIGGSVTVCEMGLYPLLAAHNTVYWHWEPKDGMTNAEILKAELCSEIFISSVNAVAKTGEIVNIDGTCNRVSAMAFGHEKVYLIVGKNKVADSLDAAIYRARNIAAPLNAKRLGAHTPCAVNADRCYNCSSDDRICKELSVLWRRPTKQKTEVVLIDENLGY